MKRVLRCNFCFDSKEIWDGIKKQYYPCTKCSRDDNHLENAVGAGRGGIRFQIQDPPPGFMGRARRDAYVRLFRPGGFHTKLYYSQGRRFENNAPIVALIRVQNNNMEYLKAGNTYLQLTDNTSVLLGTPNDQLAIHMHSIIVPRLGENGVNHDILSTRVTPREDLETFARNFHAEKNVHIAIMSNDVFAASEALQPFQHFQPAFNLGSPAYLMQLNQFSEMFNALADNPDAGVIPADGLDGADAPVRDREPLPEEIERLRMEELVEPLTFDNVVIEGEDLDEDDALNMDFEEED